MRKVMLVEDEEFILQGLKNILDWEAIGMQIVQTAHNGKEALEKWDQNPVDIIVTDISMPVMDGLDFLKELRKTEERARCIILTGYDEFDYAKRAITLDVEDYILKPINEEELEEVLKRCDEELRQLDQKQAADMDDKAGWIQFLRGNLTREEMESYLSILPEISPNTEVWPAIMKLDMESLKSARMSDVLLEFQEEKDIRVIYLSAGNLLLLLYGKQSEEDCTSRLSDIQAQIESRYAILSFISVGSPFEDYHELPASYEEAKKLQKYQVIEGYGSCMSAIRVKEKGSEDISVDNARLRKLILKKDKEGAVSYLEDLFIHVIQKDVSIDDVYKMCIQTAMLLQEIKEEYQLENRKNMQNLTELIGQIYQAEDLFTIKTIFIGEAAEIITYLHEEDSQYTPVVKQILSEVQKNYKEDMNLKTLAYKYNMNASYLGSIFQKEVGCTFAQYLSNTKNSIAKDLILNTNMRINDIAKEVGYPDTSYFYRKFKQCYGVSPASLREMKKY
ncbi:response regulator [Faecalicatena sp. AGMB00832]|uniref:Response regulator n=1 Tax=Faecalicatena faecalis TaxID=2726362 RepID=A0ABS6D8U0_9FIRM|nr:response regulator [Faecalicatena faecalis]MBU3878029.1 response regulator [Faecalicatena faecalis]